MKKYIWLSLLLLTMMGISCTKDLELEPHQIYYDNFYQTGDDALSAVNSVYDVLGSVNQYSNYLWLIQDIASDDCNARATLNDPNIHEFDTYSLESNNKYLAGIWQYSYLGISRANVVLEKVPGITMDSALQQRILGEAKFLRGLFYFNLVRLFGEVPLITVPVTPNLGDDEIYLAKSPINTVYQLIIEDFKAASILLPEKHTSASDKGRATKGAAMGLLSKVYLTQQDWENAYLTAGDVIEAGNYSLHADFATNWKEASKNGKESVFEVQFYKNATAENSQMVISGLPSLPGVFSAGVETMLPTTDLLESFEEGDYRYTATFFDNFWTYTFEPHIWKYWDQVAYKPQNTSQSGANFVLMRYSEVLLIYAEALNEANGGPTTEAYDAINTVRERARNGVADVLPDLSGLDQSSFRQAVLSERRHEFVNEGQRWFDLVRTGNLINYVKQAKGDKANPSDFNTVFPIPQRELDLNKNLKQNLGYF
ncbi:MAG: RagB/SusD family nutrient uptake outer membrane protein [Bacteroidales bacterium]|nr:RagB/SusD family nutrient uptake outer membrane protein [Bacteroidales bacterium]